MKTEPDQPKDLAPPSHPVGSQSKYPLWFWVFVALLALLFIIVLLTDPYYKQVPLWGIE